MTNSERGCLVAAARLNLNVNIDQRHRGWSDSGNARGVAERSRLHLAEFFLHLAREPADRAVIESVGNGALLGFFQAVHGALLLQQVAFVFDFGFDGFEFVADFRRKCRDGFTPISADSFFLSFKECRIQLSENRCHLFDDDLGALE